MPETEQQDGALSELVVKEVVGLGMDSPMREPILEAVRESEGEPGGVRGAPLFAAGAILGGAAGYVLGSHGDGLPVGEDLDSASDRSMVEGISERVGDTESSESEVSPPVETTTEESSDGSGSGRLGRLALVVGLVGAVALIRRRLRSGEVEEWEPIEEFGSTVTSETETDEGGAGESTAPDEGGSDVHGEVAEADTGGGEGDEATEEEE